MRKLTKMAALGLALLAPAGCVELAIGAGAAVVADEVLERRNGDDGLF